MGLMNWWFIIGIVLTAAVMLAIFWVRQRSIAVKWYEGLIGVVGLLLLLLTLQTFIGAYNEVEPGAAWMFALVLGLPSLILLAIPSLRVWRRSQST